MASQNTQPPPLQNALVGSGGLLSTPWLLWINWLYPFITNMVNYGNAAVQVPLTGFSITVNSNQSLLQLNPAGTLAAGTIVMPAKPMDGQPLEIMSTQIVTALTLTPSAGQTIKNAPTALAAGTGVAFYYNAGLATWFRRY